MSRITTRRSIGVFCAIAAVCLGVGCISTRTPAIVGADGARLPGSVASLEPITLGGVKRWILIRGQNMSSPLLLKQHGGPGQAEMATTPFNRLLERDFLVVEWDQRGAGKSADVPASEVTMEQIVSDTIELSRALLERFGRDRLILVGHSWGSAVGLQAVERAPELYRAFVSTGQMANLSAAGATGHRELLARATRTGEVTLKTELEALGTRVYVGAGAASRRGKYVGLLEKHGHFWHEEPGFQPARWMLSSSE